MTSRLEQIIRTSSLGWRRGGLMLAAALLVPAYGAVEPPPLTVAPTPPLVLATVVLTAASVFNGIARATAVPRHPDSVTGSPAPPASR